MTEADTTADTVHIRLPAGARYLRVARVVAATLASDYGADVDALDDVRLAVGEAVGLAVAAGTGAIDVRFTAGDDVLVVAGEAPSPTMTLDEDDVRLARQILRVATSSYTLECLPDSVSFVLEFARGG